MFLPRSEDAKIKRSTSVVVNALLLPVQEEQAAVHGLSGREAVGEHRLRAPGVRSNGLQGGRRRTKGERPQDLLLAHAGDLLQGAGEAQPPRPPRPWGP